MNDPPTPSFPLENLLEKVATHLALSFGKVRANTTRDLIIIFKNIFPFIPSGDYFSSYKNRVHETICERCWKCKRRLERRPLGYYCRTCQRYRRIKHSVLHWKQRGGGHSTDQSVTRK